MSENQRAKGGMARAAKLSPEERSAIASKAATKRWSIDVLDAICGSPDSPLKIGAIEIPCYVLQDGRRVLHQRGMVSGLGISRGGSSEGRGDRLAKFTAQPRLSQFVSEHLLEVTNNPIKFRSPKGAIAYGYEATILADICDSVLAARKHGLLQKQQLHIADRCEILVRGFARVGIIALVDEATGYQEIRAKDALSKILESFIAKELQVWVHTFPNDFYKEIFRLRGLQYPDESIKRPQYFGILTNDIVYKRLAPGVLDELKRVTPKSISGRPKHKYFQRLTSNVGYPKLREHLGSVVSIMKLSEDWSDFTRKVDRIHPKYNAQLQFPLEYDAEHDDGRGL